MKTKWGRPLLSLLILLLCFAMSTSRNLTEALANGVNNEAAGGKGKAVIGNNKTEHDTIREAIEAAGNASEINITLKKRVVDNSTITILYDKKVTINLNGYTLIGNIENYGNLIIKNDSGSRSSIDGNLTNILSATIDLYYLELNGDITNSGELTIKASGYGKVTGTVTNTGSVTISSTSGSGISTLENSGEAKITGKAEVNTLNNNSGGKVTITNTGYVKTLNNSGNSVTITDSGIVSTLNNRSGSVTITGNGAAGTLNNAFLKEDGTYQPGGTVMVNNSGESRDRGVTTLLTAGDNAVTISDKGFVRNLTSHGGNVIFNGRSAGVRDMNAYGGKISADSADSRVYVDGTLTIHQKLDSFTGGTTPAYIGTLALYADFTGNIRSLAMIQSKVDSPIFVNNRVASKTATQYDKLPFAVEDISTPGKYYVTVEDAVAKGAGGVKLLDNVDAVTLTLDNKTINIDLNGKTINTLTNSGKVTVKGTGTVGTLTNSGNNAEASVRGGTVGTLTNQGLAGIESGTVTTLSNGGTVNVTNGTVTELTNTGGTANVNGGTVTTLTNYGTAEVKSGTVTTLIMEAASSSYSIQDSGGIGTVVFKHDYNGTVIDDQMVKLGGDSARVFLGDRVLAEKTQAVRFKSLPFAVEDSTGTKYASAEAAIASGKEKVTLLGNLDFVTVASGQTITIDLNGKTIAELNNSGTVWLNQGFGTVTRLENLSIGTVHIYGPTIRTLNNAGTATIGYYWDLFNGWDSHSSRIFELNNLSSGTVTAKGSEITTANNAGTFTLASETIQTEIASFRHQTANAVLEADSSADYVILMMHLLADLRFADIKNVQMLVNDTVDGAPLFVNNRALLKQTTSVSYDSLPYAVEDSETPGKYYVNVEDAANKNASGVKLPDNVSSVTVDSGKTISIDLNGKTITKLENSGTVTITGTSGTVKTLNNKTSGTANVTGGTVTTLNNDGNTTITGGTVTTLENNGGGTATVSGGKVDTLYTSGTATVSGGRVDTIGNSSLQFRISGGEIHMLQNGNCVAVEGGSIYKLTNYSGTADITGGTVAELENYSTANVNGGTVDTLTSISEANVSGGTVGTLTNIGEANVSGGDVDRADNEGTITISGDGKVTTLNNNTNGTANVNGGEVSRAVNEGSFFVAQNGTVNELVNTGAVMVGHDDAELDGGTVTELYHRATASSLSITEYGTVGMLVLEANLTLANIKGEQILLYNNSNGAVLYVNDRVLANQTDAVRYDSLPFAVLDDSNVKHAGVEASIAAGKTSVKLLGDVNEVTVKNGETIAIDLNGKTIKTLNNSGKVTVKGTGTVETLESSGNNAEASVLGGTVETLTNRNGGLVGIEGGTVETLNNQVGGITLAAKGKVTMLINSGTVTVGYNNPEFPVVTVGTLVMETKNSSCSIRSSGNVGTLVFKHNYDGTVTDNQMVKLDGDSGHVFLGDRVLAEKTKAVRFDSLSFAVLGSMLEDMPGTKFASVNAAVEQYHCYVKLLGNMTQIDVAAGQGVRLNLNNHTVTKLNIAANGDARIKNGTIGEINSSGDVVLDGNVTVTALNVNGGDGAAYNSTVGTLNNRCDAGKSFEVHGGTIGVVNNYGSMEFQCNRESGEYQDYQVTTLNNFSGGTAKLLGGTFTTVNNAGACEIGGNHRQTVSITNFYHQTANAGLEVIAGITLAGVYYPTAYSIGTMHLLADLSFANIKDAQMLVNNTANGAPLVVNDRALFKQTNPVSYSSLPHAVEDSETPGKYYANVEDAANKGAKGVKLPDDVSSVTVANGKTITIDLNGKTINELSNSGTVTVTGTSGTVKMLNNKTSGTVTVSGGTVTMLDNSGTATVTGGTITELNNQHGGTATITGGMVGTLANSGTATVKGGTVTTLYHKANATGLSITEDGTVGTLVSEADLALENIKGEQMLLNARSDGAVVFANDRVLAKQTDAVRYDSLPFAVLDDSNVKHAGVEVAIAAGKTGVKLLGDVNEVTVKSGETITIGLNGNTITTLNNSGTVTISGTSGTVGTLENSGTAQVTGGTVNMLHHKADAIGLSIGENGMVDVLALNADLSFENIKGEQMLRNVNADGTVIFVNDRALALYDSPVRYDTLPIMVVGGSGGKYANVEAAIAAGEESVRLLSDVENVTVEAGKTITIDPDGHTITTLNNEGNTTITGGTVTTLNNEGNANVSGGAVNALNNAGNAVISDGTVNVLTGSGEAEIVGGTINKADNEGTITVSGNGNVAELNNKAEGNANVKGGTVRTLRNDGKANVSGGTVHTLNNKGNAEMNGGTVNSLNNNGSSIIVSGVIGMIENTGSLSIAGGSFKNDPTHLLKDGFAAVMSEDGTYVIQHAHVYGPVVYTWSDDNRTCTATRVCIYDETHVETETVTGTAVITRKQSCTEDELTTYTATFTNPAFAEQVKEDVKTADRLGHDISDEWSTDGQNSWHACSRCDYITDVTPCPEDNGNTLLWAALLSLCMGGAVTAVVIYKKKNAVK